MVEIISVFMYEMYCFQKKCQLMYTEKKNILKKQKLFGPTTYNLNKQDPGVCIIVAWVLRLTVSWSGAVGGGCRALVRTLRATDRAGQHRGDCGSVTSPHNNGGGGEDRQNTQSVNTVVMGDQVGQQPQIMRLDLDRGQLYPV